MTQDIPLSEDEIIDALAECLLIFARRGRAIREAKEKEAVELGHSQVRDNPDPVMNMSCSIEKDTDVRPPKSTPEVSDQQSQVNIVPDQYDI